MIEKELPPHAEASGEVVQAPEVKKMIADKIVGLFGAVKKAKDAVGDRVEELVKIAGFDLERRLNESDKPFIEIAGPTPGGYKQVDFSNLNRKVHTSNVFPGCPSFKDGTIMYDGKVDFIADGMQLPVKDGALGAVFVSALGGGHLKDMSVKLGDRKFKSSAHGVTYNPDKRREKGVLFNDQDRSRDNISTAELVERTIKEARRILADGGLLVWQGRHTDIRRRMKENGFRLKLARGRNFTFEKVPLKKTNDPEL